MQSTFYLIDSGGKGYLTKDDVQRLAQDVGEPVSQKRAKVLVSLCSLDGKIDIDDFNRLFSPPSPPVME
jgi:Ca2+-binding EF-hand superfamily protein